jgi:hypothetical protein
MSGKRALDKLIFVFLPAMKNKFWVITLIIVVILVAAAFWQKNTIINWFGRMMVSKTVVIHYTPSSNLSLETKNGSCWTNSIAAPFRLDAWRCMVGNEIYDPCFEISGKKSVICDVNPALSKQGFELKLTENLPEPSVQTDTLGNWAWIVELDDGSICTPFTGTRPFINGDAGYYGCASISFDKSVMIMGDLVKGATWYAKESTFSVNGYNLTLKFSKQTPVKTVWQ